MESNGNAGVYFWDKKKATTSIVRSGLQLPGRNIINSGFAHSITDAKSPVKIVLSSSSEGNKWLLTGWADNKKELSTYDIGEGYDSSDSTNAKTTHTCLGEGDVLNSRLSIVNDPTKSQQKNSAEISPERIHSLHIPQKIGDNVFTHCRPMKNAILLDSELHQHHKNNAQNDYIALDHKLYSLGKQNGETALYKLTVEDYFQSKSEQSKKRFHNLKYIEKVADISTDALSDTIGSGGSAIDISATTYNLADL